MQLVDITLTPLQRRNRVAFAVTSFGAPAPDTGEHVVVRDQSGAYFGALVVDSAYDQEGRGTHRLRLGAALPESIAERRLARPVHVASPEPGGLHDQITQYLAEAADFHAAFGRGATVPHQG